MKLFEKARAWWNREQVHTVLGITMVAATMATYALIFYLGRQPAPPPAAGSSLFLQIHPERLLACGASLFGMLTAARRFQAGEPLLEPLCWILVASLVHLSSLAIQLRLV